MRFTRMFAILRSNKTPLTLAVTAQAYTVFVWLTGMTAASLTGSLFVLTVIFALITALSLDLIVVSTTFDPHRNTWSWATAIFALIGSVLIVVDLFYGMHWLFLHAIFPTMVFFYSQHLAESKHIARNEQSTVIPLSVTEYRVKVIRALLLEWGYTSKTKIKDIVGGKSETTGALIDNVAKELGLYPDENTALQSGE
jgi:drug/metabolite transporter superfamily protein YnfA